MRTSLLLITISLAFCETAYSQSVCLPAPRLLTTTPMGGQVGTTLDVTIAGDNIEDAGLLRFSHPAITAVPKLAATGLPIPNRFVVTIDKNCPPGIHEARVMTRLGLSTSRVFSVGTLPEVLKTKPNTSLETAVPLVMNSVCNSVMTSQAIDYFSFDAQQGQRVFVDVAAQGIDSKLKPVLIVADASGADLYVQRRGGAVDFKAPTTGKYVIKVHDLTYKGGSPFFYRLAVRAVAEGDAIARLPSTRNVSAFSWPPTGLTDDNIIAESEPNSPSQPMEISLPCDISGAFFPAADVDTFEFTAKKGEVWWVEVASERLGRPTDPAVVVQLVKRDGEQETFTDVAEMNDIPSPIKVSSNGYSYDGPPYNAGSTDVNGRIEIKEDGTYRLHMRDLFGGTRSDPANIYRMVIRKQSPDFALVGWALHMNLRNGDRNALSKPVALRGGTTMAIEILRVGRDGFGEEVELSMEGLPEGVSAAGITMKSGQARGLMLITADADAPRGFSNATIYGKSMISGKEVIRKVHMASMKWPVPDASQEIPAPRLQADFPVSVCGSELAPFTISSEQDTFEVGVGEQLTIPLKHDRRCDFSGASINLKNWCAGIGTVAAFDAKFNDSGSQAVLDLAAMKTKPGEYIMAFYGSGVAKYRYNPGAIDIAKAALEQAKQQASAAAAKARKISQAVASTPADQVTAEQKATAAKAAEDQKAADAKVAAAEQRLKDVTAKAQPKDIVDIIVSKPITIRVKPAAKAAAK